jgi:hypothetical protein
MNNPISWSTARNSIALACVILASATGLAENSPRLMQDPVLGLRYHTAKIHFDALPADVQAACPALVNERWDRHLWVLASTRDAAKSYYVVGGYFVLRQQEATAPRVEPDVRGAVFEVANGQCALLGPAREVFDSRPEELAEPMLEALAVDLAARYTRAFGGAVALRAAMRRQRVSPERLPAALRDAFMR